MSMEGDTSRVKKTCFEKAKKGKQLTQVHKPAKYSWIIVLGA